MDRSPREVRSGVARHRAAATIPSIALAAWMAAGMPARAGDLPGDLLAAARADHDPAEKRRACSEFQPMTIKVGLGSLADAQAHVSGLSDLPPDTRGVHLADGQTGAPAPPFVQALLDAGVATRLSLNWTIVRREVTRGVPVLQDLGTPSADAPPPSPPYVDHEVRFERDAFVVTGPDRAFFPNEHAYGYMVGPTTDQDYDDPAGTVAPGFWTTRHVCVVLVPDRVLEFSDVRAIGNGFTQVTAALLFRPQRLPAWVADPRVIAALGAAPRPWTVKVSVFRNDGSGWRQLPGSSGSLEYMTHVVGAVAP